MSHSPLTLDQLLRATTSQELGGNFAKAVLASVQSEEGEDPIPIPTLFSYVNHIKTSSDLNSFADFWSHFHDEILNGLNHYACESAVTTQTSSPFLGTSVFSLLLELKAQTRTSVDVALLIWADVMIIPFRYLEFRETSTHYLDWLNTLQKFLLIDDGSDTGWITDTVAAKVYHRCALACAINQSIRNAVVLSSRSLVGSDTRPCQLLEDQIMTMCYQKCTLSMRVKLISDLSSLDARFLKSGTFDRLVWMAPMPSPAYESLFNVAHLSYLLPPANLSESCSALRELFIKSNAYWVVRSSFLSPSDVIAWTQNESFLIGLILHLWDIMKNQTITLSGILDNSATLPDAFLGALLTLNRSRLSESSTFRSECARVYENLINSVIKSLFIDTNEVQSKQSDIVGAWIMKISPDLWTELGKQESLLILFYRAILSVSGINARKCGIDIWPCLFTLSGSSELITLMCLESTHQAPRILQLLELEMSPSAKQVDRFKDTFREVMRQLKELKSYPLNLSTFASKCGVVLDPLCVTETFEMIHRVIQCQPSLLSNLKSILFEAESRPESPTDLIEIAASMQDEGTRKRDASEINSPLSKQMKLNELVELPLANEILANPCTAAKLSRLIHLRLGHWKRYEAILSGGAFDCALEKITQSYPCKSQSHVDILFARYCISKERLDLLLACLRKDSAIKYDRKHAPFYALEHQFIEAMQNPSSDSNSIRVSSLIDRLLYLGLERLDKKDLRNELASWMSDLFRYVIPSSKQGGFLERLLIGYKDHYSHFILCLFESSTAGANENVPNLFVPVWSAMKIGSVTGEETKKKLSQTIIYKYVMGGISAMGKTPLLVAVTSCLFSDHDAIRMYLELKVDGQITERHKFAIRRIFEVALNEAKDKDAFFQSWVPLIMMSCRQGRIVGAQTLRIAASLPLFLKYLDSAQGLECLLKHLDVSSIMDVIKNNLWPVSYFWGNDSPCPYLRILSVFNQLPLSFQSHIIQNIEAAFAQRWHEVANDRIAEIFHLIAQVKNQTVITVIASTAHADKFRGFKSLCLDLLASLRHRHWRILELETRVQVRRSVLSSVHNATDYLRLTHDDLAFHETLKQERESFLRDLHSFMRWNQVLSSLDASAVPHKDRVLVVCIDLLLKTKHLDTAVALLRLVQSQLDMSLDSNPRKEGLYRDLLMLRLPDMMKMVTSFESPVDKGNFVIALRSVCRDLEVLYRKDSAFMQEFTRSVLCGLLDLAKDCDDTDVLSSSDMVKTYLDLLQSLCVEMRGDQTSQAVLLEWVNAELRATHQKYPALFNASGLDGLNDSFVGDKKRGGFGNGGGTEGGEEDGEIA